jgi:undecaprenyl-diphosphatase
MSDHAPHDQSANSWLSAVRRLRHTEGIVLVPLLMLVLSVWAFVELTDEVTEGEAQTFDERVMRGLRERDDPRQPIGPSWLKGAALDITALGGHTVLTLVVISVTGYLILDRKRHAMWLVLIATVGGWGLSLLLKELIGRPRPSVIPHLVEVQSLSFPSGHAMMSAVVYLTLGALLAQIVQEWALRVYFLTTALILTLLVGLSRVYLGVHYPTDVLAGWSAGLTWAILCWLVARWLQRRGLVEKPREHTDDLHTSTS